MNLDLKSKRTYMIRDYTNSQHEHDPDDYAAEATGLTWEEAKKWIDDRTDPETQGAYAIHEEAPPPFFVVCVTLSDRAYGGPEEGDWWYDTANPEDQEAKWLTHELGGPWLYPSGKSKEAYAKCNEMNEALKQSGANRGRLSVDSVLSIGQYQCTVFEGYPCYMPRETPIYE